MPLSAILQIVQIIAGVASAAYSGQKLLEAFAKAHPNEPINHGHIVALQAADRALGALVVDLCDAHDRFAAINRGERDLTEGA